MIEKVIKRDGRVEDFVARKLNGWGEWSSKNLGSTVDWSGVVLHVVNVLPKTTTSKAIQEAAIRYCLDKRTWEYNLMAGRLYATLMLKEIHGGKYPTVKEVHKQLQEVGIMRVLDYSDEEYAQVEKIINHSLNLKSAHYSLFQTRTKYSLQDRVGGKEYETPQFVFMRMAMALSEKEPKETRMKDVAKFYDHFSKKRINAPTPYLVNLGTDLNAFASCNVYTTDDTWRSLAAGDHIAYVMTASSAGIGSHIKTRSLGDKIRGGIIKHQGKLPYYRALVGAINANTQVGRGGSATQHYTAFDPEVEVIQKLKNPMTPASKQVRGLDYSFGSNKFFARLVAKDDDVCLFSYADAPELYEAQYDKDDSKFEKLYYEFVNSDKPRTVLKARTVVLGALQEAFDTGRHYLHFTDTMNKHTPFKEKIYSSNLCVAPETLVLTDNGYHHIADLEGLEVNVWNGKEWSDVIVKKTGQDQKLVKVVTDSGFELECTPYHKFYVVKTYGNDVVEKRAHELNAGDKLIKSDYPIIDGAMTLENAYENGLFSAEGCVTKNGKRLYLYHEKRKLKDFIDLSIFKGWSVQDSFNREYGTTDLLKDKFFVPFNDYSVESKVKWLEGFLDGDGVVCRNNKTQSVQVTSVNKNFLLELQLMLQTLGIYSKVTRVCEEGYKSLPLNDGTGGKGDFWCKEAWRLMFDQSAIVTLLGLGFSPKRLVITNHVPNRNASQFVKIVSVSDEGRFDDTYCFEEPKRHMGVFNGILTGQCQEIALPTAPFGSVEDLYKDYDEETGSEIALCNIAGIVPSNIESDEQYAEVAYYALKMVDAGIHLSEYVFKNLEDSAKARMNAGVGIVGMAHYMAKNNKKYTTQDGLNFTHTLAETHAWHLYNASLRLGKEKGNAPWMHKTFWPEGWLPLDTYEKRVDSLVTVENKRDWESLRKAIVENGGIRNSVCIAHMPAESSSLLSETTNGVYPIRDYDLLKTNDTSAVPYVVPDSTKMRSRYEIAWDITSSDLIKVYAVLQKWTDQAISADLYRRMQGDTKVGTSEMLSTYLDLVRYGVKTRYYQNSLTGKDVILDSSDNVVEYEASSDDDCEACKL